MYGSRPRERRTHGCEYRYLLEAITSHLPAALFILDSKFRVVWVNSAAEHYFGVSKREVVGRCKRELINQRIKHMIEDSERFAEKVLGTYDDNTYIEKFECHVQPSKSRPERWLEYCARPIGCGPHAGGRIDQYYDISERKRMEQRLHALSGQLSQLQEEERRRIARELHETIAQQLVTLKINLSLANESSGQLDPKARQAVSESLSLADQCLREIRTLSYLLRPPLLDEAGIVSALRWYADGFSQRTGVRVELDVLPDLGRLSQEVETTIFRIVQECLTNIHLHSGSPTAKICVVRNATTITAEVKDEGCGIRGERVREDASHMMVGVGIAGMRERAEKLGGRLEISPQDLGTTVKVILPLDKPRL